MRYPSLEQEIKTFLNLKRNAVVLPVKHKKQINTWTCGGTSLKIVFSHLGIHYSVRELSERCKTTKEDGTPFRNIVRVAKEEGCLVDVIRNGTPRDLRYYLNRGIPVIVVHQMSNEIGDTHYSVVIGYDENSFAFCEPARWYAYYTKKSIKRFKAVWKDLEGGTKGDGIAIYLPETRW